MSDDARGHSEAARDYSLPDDHNKDAPLLERLRSWITDIDQEDGWYEISNYAAASLRADLAEAVALLDGAQSA